MSTPKTVDLLCFVFTNQSKTSILVGSIGRSVGWLMNGCLVGSVGRRVGCWRPRSPRSHEHITAAACREGKPQASPNERTNERMNELLRKRGHTYLPDERSTTGAAMDNTCTSQLVVSKVRNSLHATVTCIVRGKPSHATPSNQHTGHNESVPHHPKWHSTHTSTSNVR